MMASAIADTMAALPAVNGISRLRRRDVCSHTGPGFSTMKRNSRSFWRLRLAFRTVPTLCLRPAFAPQ